MLRFSAEHRFPGPPAAVAAILADAGFYQDLHLPDLELLDVATGSDGLVLRYEFTGNLDATARRLLGGERLTWSQGVHLDGASSGRLDFAAEANPRLLHGRATFLLDAEGAGGPASSARPATGSTASAASTASTVRRLEGELTVALPLVGGMAERRIVPGVLARLDVEAEAVRESLGAGPDGGSPGRP